MKLYCMLYNRKKRDIEWRAKAKDINRKSEKDPQMKGDDVEGEGREG